MSKMNQDELYLGNGGSKWNLRKIPYEKCKVLLQFQIHKLKRCQICAGLWQSLFW